MPSSGKLVRAAALLILSGFVAAAVCLYFDVPARFQRPPVATSARPIYTCPMHAEIVQGHSGPCPKCGMALVSGRQAKAGHDACGDGGENHPGCCATPSVTGSATALRLPPGHPPIRGWTTDATPEREPAPPHTPAHSSP